MSHFVDVNGNIYVGDRLPGSREAVSDEILFFQLKATKLEKLAELDTAYRNAIANGFVSSALGGNYTYPLQDQDQSNFNSSAIASMLPGTPLNWVTPFWCADQAGVWAMRQHTAAQIQQVGKEAMAAKLGHIQTLTALQDSVNAITTSTENAVEQVKAIVWPV